VVPAGAAGDLVIVVSEPPTDPREQVAQVVELVTAQDEAANEAKVALADRAAARRELEMATVQAVGRILTAIRRFAGGDLTWKHDGSRPLSELVVSALESGRTVFEQRPQTVLADQGVLSEGQELATGSLTATLAGDPPRRDGLWRADLVRQLRLRQRLQGTDGLPVPGGGEAEPPGDTRLAVQAVPSTITEKVDALVEAIRLPEDPPIVVSFGPKSPTATEVASGASLLVDVEFGRGRNLYALSQGVFGGGPPGAPAQPNIGSLVKVNGNGTFTAVADGLDRPTSLEFIGNTAYVVTLSGEIWKLDSVSGPPYGVSRSE
jgi:hypothetical protein